MKHLRDCIMDRIDYYQYIHYLDKSITTPVKAINVGSFNDFYCCLIKLLFNQPMAHK